jgi:predicted DNA-binding protein
MSAPCYVETMSQARVMHQTTIRFGHELWQELEDAAERGGVSVAHYVREAAIERLVRRGGFGPVDRAVKRLADAEFSTAAAREASTALAAQSRLAASRSRQLRDQAQATRKR